MKSLLYPASHFLYVLNEWAKRCWIEISVVVALILVILFGIAHHQASFNSPITVQTDCGLILDVDDVGPDSRQSKIKTDKMIALTDLRFSTSIPGGSRLYYVERASGHKGWLIAP